MTDTPLSVPSISPRPGGYEFAWAPEQIYLRLERLREHHDAISAEIWVEQGETRAHLVGGLRFGLTTTTGRTTMAKLLQSRRNGVDWGGMMEQVCIYALRRFREQDAFTHIGDLPIDTELRFRLSPVIPEGVTTLLFGYGDSLKTHIAYTWGLSVQLGEPILGLTPLAGPVMLLDWETNQALANRVQRAIHAGMGMKGVTPYFFFRRCRRPFVEFVEDVKAVAEREGVALIIMDSFTKAAGGEKEAKENALPTLNALEWVGRTNLVITHRPKPREGGESAGAYGSVYIENDVRQGFRVESRHEPQEGAAQVALFHTKHNLMPPLPPFGYRITWDKLSGTRVERQEVSAMEGLRERLQVIAQIQAVLHQGPLSVKDITFQTGLKEDSVGRTLRRYAGKSVVSLGGSPILWGLLTRPGQDDNND